MHSGPADSRKRKRDAYMTQGERNYIPSKAPQTTSLRDKLKLLAAQGNTSSMAFLCQSSDITADDLGEALNWAAENGQQGVIEFIFSQRTGEYTAEHIEFAFRWAGIGNQFPLLSWFLTHYGQFISPTAIQGTLNCMDIDALPQALLWIENALGSLPPDKALAIESVLGPFKQHLQNIPPPRAPSF